MFHQAVLLKESIEWLITDPGGIYVDATFGGGGHSREIMKHLGRGKLIAFDQDDDTRANVINDERFMLINANYRYMKNFLRYHGAIPVRGILADLGISSNQIDVPEKGFSIRYDERLDMRMDRRQSLSAFEVVNTYSKEDLHTILKNYGEIKNAGRLAQAIILEREKEPIETTGRLVDIASNLASGSASNKYLGQVFQAIRIEVNRELESLRIFLEQCNQVLAVDGRLAVIAYHSLEDRLVKNFIRSGNFEGNIEKDFYGNVQAPWRQLTRKPLVPDAKEMKENPRSRSAKLRIAEKI